MTKKILSRKQFIQGIKEGIPIFLGYFSISITFGMIVKSSGLSGIYAILMSMTNFTGATQFISVNMLTLDIPIYNILLTSFMINARYFLMSLCLIEVLSKKINKPNFAWISFGVTDEVFVLSMSKKELSKNFVYGTQIISWIGWVSGTIFGVVLSNFIPKSFLDVTGIALFVMYIALLLPPVLNSKKIALISLVSSIISSLIYFIPVLKGFIGNWRIIITMIISSIIGAIFFPIRKREQNE